MFNDSIFGENAKLDVYLKNPNQFKEAVLYEVLRNLPESKRKEFVKSEEAKVMIKEGIITQDTVDRLSPDPDKSCHQHHNHCNDNIFNIALCNKAKEESDPIWDELVKCRIQERRLMNELIEKYGPQAKAIANSTKFVETCIPEYFRT